jgi:hypothetical protein
MFVIFQDSEGIGIEIELMLSLEPIISEDSIILNFAEIGGITLFPNACVEINCREKLIKKIESTKNVIK